MKKTSRILILVLSLALVFGMLAIVANASEEAVNLAELIENAENGTVKLESDAYVDATVNVASDLTIDLNGYTLTTTANPAFKGEAGTTLTITGGRIEAGEVLYSSTVKGGNAPTLNINGVTINHTSEEVVTIVSMVEGNCNVANSTIVSTAPYKPGSKKDTYNEAQDKSLNYDAGTKYSMFHSEATTGDLGVTWNFNKVTVSSENTAWLAEDYSISQNTHSNSFISVNGTQTTATLTDCYVKFVGHMFYADRARGRFVQATSAPSAYDLAVPVYDENGVMADGSTAYYTNVVEAYNCVFDASAEYTYRTQFIYTGAGLGTQGSFYFSGCDITNYYSSSSTAYSGNHNAVDPLAVVLDNGSVYRFLRVNTSGDKGCLVQNADVHLYGGSSIVNVGNSNTTLVTRSGNIYAEVGARFATPPLYANRIVWLDKDGTVLSKLRYQKDKNGYFAVCDNCSDPNNSGVEFVLDPAGNLSAPWVSVKAGTKGTYTSAQQNNLWTSAAATYLEQLDDYDFVHTSAANFANYPYAGVAKFQAPDANGAVLVGGSGEAGFNCVASNADNGKYNGKTTVAIFMNDFWWHQTGNIGVLRTEGNAYGRWYMPQNPNDPTATTLKSTGNAAEWGLTPKGATPKLRGSGYSVVVYETNFATDTEMPDLTVKLHVRSNADDSQGSFDIVNGAIVSNSFVQASGATADQLKLNPAGEWNNMTLVNYMDETKANGGMQYWFLNGNLVAVVDGLTSNAANIANASFYGLRFVCKSKIYTVGDSFLFDNFGARFYTTTLFGDSAAAPTPEKYVAPLLTGSVESGKVASVNGVAYDTVTEAITAAKGGAVDLIADVTEKVVTDKVAQVYTNGYTFEAAQDSVSFFEDYNNDGDTDPYITFDASKKVPFAFTTLTDSEGNVTAYDIQYVSIGSLPTRDIMQPKLIKKGQQLYKGTQIGWIDVGTDDLVAPVSESDYWNFYGDELTADEFEELLLESYRAVPAYTETAVASNVTLFIIKNDGTIRGEFSGDGFWNSNIREWKIGYGETVLLNKNANLNGGFAFTGIDDSLPREQKVISLDLNGYTLSFNPVAGDTDTQNFINISEGSTFNLYSSVPGGTIKTVGVHTENNKTAPAGITPESSQEEINANYNVYGMNASSVIYIEAHKLNGVAAGENGKPYAMLDALSRSNPDYDTKINIGTVTDYSGTACSGSNLTFYADSIVGLASGNIDSVVNIDSINYNRHMNGALGIVYLERYMGKVNVTNCSIYGGAKSTANNDLDYLVYARDAGHFTANDGQNYRYTPEVVVDGGFFYTAHNGQWLVRGENNIGSVTFKNFKTNGAIKGDSDDFDVLYYGENVTANIGADAKPVDETIKLYVKNEALAAMSFNWHATINNESITLAASGSNYVYKYSCGFGTQAVTIPACSITNYTTAEEIDSVEVTVVGTNGVATVLNYVVGAEIRVNNFSDLLKAINGTITNVTFKGTFNNGEVTLPVVATEDVTLTADTTVTNTATGFLQNVSLYTELGFNVYVPYKYADIITSITVDGVKVEDAPVVTVNGEQYYKLTVGKNVTKLNDNVVVTVKFKENGIESEKTYTLSVKKYIDVIKNGNYSEAEKNLMNYIENFAYEAETHFKGESSFTKPEVEAIEKSYTAMTAEEFATISKVFASATINLNGSAPVYEFVVAADFNGTVTLNGKAYEVKAGDKIVVDNLRAYNFLAGVKVVAEGVNVTFKFENYAAQAAENVKALVDAIYDYCYAAAEFKKA